MTKMTEWYSFFDLLQANVGKTADLVLEEDKKVSGDIVSAKGAGLDAIVILKTTTGYLLIKSHDISQVSIKGDLNQQKETKNMQTTISVNFKETKSSQKLGVDVFIKGI